MSPTVWLIWDDPSSRVLLLLLSILPSSRKELLRLKSSWMLVIFLIISFQRGNGRQPQEKEGNLLLITILSLEETLTCYPHIAVHLLTSLPPSLPSPSMPFSSFPSSSFEKCLHHRTQRRCHTHGVVVWLFFLFFHALTHNISLVFLRSLRTLDVHELGVSWCTTAY